LQAIDSVTRRLSIGSNYKSKNIFDRGLPVSFQNSGKQIEGHQSLWSSILRESLALTMMTHSIRSVIARATQF